MLANNLGANIRNHRTTLGLSQEALAKNIGVDRTYIGSLERGERNPSLRVVEQIAARLGLDPLALLGPPGEPPRWGQPVGGP